MKQSLLIIFVLLLLNADIKAQSPIIAYPATTNLAPGVPVSITPTNSGGLIPATVYGNVTTFSGSTAGPGVSAGYVSSTAALSRYKDIQAIVGDPLTGNIYIAEADNNDIRKITPDGSSSIVAGSPSGAAGYKDGPGPDALFNIPDGIAIDGSGNIFVGDWANNNIRKITPDGTVSTFATLVTGASELSFDAAGNLWVAEQNVSQIQMITPAGAVTTIAGNGHAGYRDGTGVAAQFYWPNDVEVDRTSGNIIVADYLNNNIRKVTPSGVVTTLAGGTATGYVDGVGTAALFFNPTGVVSASGGVVYVSDLLNGVVRRVMPDGTVSTVAGGGPSAMGTTDGIGTAARFGNPVDMYIDGTGTGYVIDGINNNVRKITLTGYSINGTLPAGLTFNPATGTISGTPTASFAPITYTVTAFNTAGYSAATFTLTSYNYWKGLTTDWAAASNWSLNTVPGATDAVQIGVSPYTGIGQPVVNNPTLVGSIEFGTNNAPILTITGNRALTVANGIQVDAASTVNINGPGNINLSGASVVNPTGSLTAGLNLTITLGASSTLTNKGTFNLASDADGSASITAIPSNSAVNGQVSVQRYISAHRGYRLASSPVYAATINSNKVYSINYVIKSTFVTGYSAATGGFDAYGNPSMYFYRENMIPTTATFTSSCYRALQSITNSPDYMLEVDGGPFNLPVGNGYMFYFRGGRATVNPYDPASIPDPSTLTATGTLNQGTIIVKDWFTPTTDNLSYTTSSPVGTIGYNLVGNPYPSSIDWDQFNNGGITASNVAPFITTMLSNGSYATYTAGLGSGGSTTPLATNIILSGQGFFVQAIGPGAKLTFTEAAKTSAQVLAANLTMSTAAVPKTNVQYLRLQMALDTFYNENILIRFNNTEKTTFDPKIDAIYRVGFGKVSLSSLSSDHVQLAINQQPLPKLQAQVIGLNVSATESGAYHLNMKDLVGVPQLYDVWLMDNYKKDSVNMRVTNIYNFNVDNGDTSSFGAKRFNLVIKQNPAYAYRLLDFNANKVSTAHQVNVLWKTQYEENYTNFTVERSVDGGKTFNVLGGVNADGQGNYAFLDKSPVNGQDLYRLKQEDINNTISYSKIVGIFYSDLSNNMLSSKISIFPNPVNSNINVAFASEATESSIYNIRFMSSTGLVVKEITSSQPSWQGTLSNLQPGTYIVRVVNNKTQSLVGENKFVKL